MDDLHRVIKSYELRDLIGAGSFGAVYRAHQRLVEREVAIKIIWPVFANHPNFIRRFELEAQLIANLEHPYIVPLYDYWRDPEGAYLVMRWLKGGALSDKIRDADWGLEHISQMLGQICAALNAAHRANTIHLDLKPENILMDDEHNAYLADFGIARIISSTQQDRDEFASMGSLAYSAPEQLTNGVLTPQADIYSLGVILYELLAGQHPFPHLEELTQTDLLTFRASEPLPDIGRLRPDLPRAVNDVIQRATAFQPEERYPDALSFFRAFRDAIKDQTSSSIAVGRFHEGIGANLSDDVLISNPYKGLRAFQESDANNFYGRQNLVQQFINRLSRDEPYHRFLAVVGPSGSGKSSVVKAGLLPALRRGAVAGSSDWFYAEMVPGPQPFDELEATLIGLATNVPPDLKTQLRGGKDGLLKAIEAVLPSDGSELCLIIDQFEEVFTLVEQETETERFLELLHVAITHPATRLRLIITLRADFYDRPLLYTNLSDLMSRRTEVVVPLNRDELESAIIRPSQNVGVVMEEALITAIIAEVSERPRALPLLQYALSELFERRRGNYLLLDDYQAIGGVRGALARRADEIYNQLDPDQREATRQLFLRLITLGEGTEDTRRRALLSEVKSLAGKQAAMLQVIDLMAQSRLITLDRDPITRSPTVEVTHEAIIRQWQTLRDWLDDSRNDVRLQRSLADLADDWAHSERDKSFLLRGTRLEQYAEWAARTTLALTELERDFLGTSLREQQRQEQEERERREREEALERRAVQRLRLLVGVLLLAVIIAGGLTAFATAQSQLAQLERDRAQSLALEAIARRVFNEGDSDLAVVLAMEANRSANASSQARRTLGEIALSIGTRHVLTGHTARVSDVDISADGRYVATGSTDFTVRLWSVETGEQLRIFGDTSATTGLTLSHQGDVEAVAFSPDGTKLASGAFDFQTIIWDVETGAALRRLGGHTGPVRALAFTPSGEQLLTGANDNLMILWDVETGQEIRRFVGNRGSVVALSLSPDGTQVVSASVGGELIIWDLATASIVRRLQERGTGFTDVAFSPDGLHLLASIGGGQLLYWDAVTGNLLNNFQVANFDVRSIAFFPDNRRVLLGLVDGTLRIWDVQKGVEINRLNGHAVQGLVETDVLAVAMTKDGRLVASASRDKTARLWNMNNTGEVAQLFGHQGRVVDVQFTPDGQRAVSLGIDGTLRLWDWASGQQISQIQDTRGNVRAFDLSPDGRIAILGFNNGEVHRWDLVTNEQIGLFSLHSVAIASLSYSPDGRSVLSADQDGIIIHWDAFSGSVIRQMKGHNGTVFDLAYSADGLSFVSGGRDGKVILWDLTTGESVQTYMGHEEPVYSVAISHDGRTILSASRDSYIIVWDRHSGAQQRRLSGHTDAVWSIALSPDDLRVLSSSGDGQIILWDVVTGDIEQQFTAASQPIFSVAFHPNAQVGISGGEDGVVQLWWTFDLPQLMSWTETNRYVRPLTCAERELYRILNESCPAGQQ